MNKTHLDVLKDMVSNLETIIAVNEQQIKTHEKHITVLCETNESCKKMVNSLKNVISETTEVSSMDNLMLSMSKAFDSFAQAMIASASAPSNSPSNMGILQSLLKIGNIDTEYDATVGDILKDTEDDIEEHNSVETTINESSKEDENSETKISEQESAEEENTTVDNTTSEEENTTVDNTTSEEETTTKETADKEEVAPTEETTSVEEETISEETVSVEEEVAPTEETIVETTTEETVEEETIAEEAPTTETTSEANTPKTIVNDETSEPSNVENASDEVSDLSELDDVSEDIASTPSASAELGTTRADSKTENNEPVVQPESPSNNNVPRFSAIIANVNSTPTQSSKTEDNKPTNSSTQFNDIAAKLTALGM